MIILNKTEAKQINNMHPACTRYCMYPEEKYIVAQIKEWMSEPPKEKWEKKQANLYDETANSK